MRNPALQRLEPGRLSNRCREVVGRWQPADRNPSPKVGPRGHPTVSGDDSRVNWRETLYAGPCVADDRTGSAVQPLPRGDGEMAACGSEPFAGSWSSWPINGVGGWSSGESVRDAVCGNRAMEERVRSAGGTPPRGGWMSATHGSNPSLDAYPRGWLPVSATDHERSGSGRSDWLLRCRGPSRVHCFCAAHKAVTKR
jgi:hypothetical protein